MHKYLIILLMGCGNAQAANDCSEQIEFALYNVNPIERVCSNINKVCGGASNYYSWNNYQTVCDMVITPNSNDLDIDCFYYATECDQLIECSEVSETVNEWLLRVKEIK